MTVIKNGETQQKSYEEICKDLGFIAEVNFVEVTSTGRISYTIGKPDEIKALYHSAQNAGYEPSRALIRCIKNL